ncbi:MAG: tetratricopeptide repeat protein [Candidatus Gastranaerophilales bacterium]|nr:tetratricopeptide repeat protein [Candidatus Gastranaerophilales bacterium]
MDLSKKIKKYFLLSAMFLTITIFAADTISAKIITEDFNKTNTLLKQTYYLENAIYIKLNYAPPENLKDQKKAAFKILQPLLSKNIVNANVLWQKNDFSYGKKASISSIYITDFLNKKINTEKFIEHFNLELIEPLKVRKNKIKPINISEISHENLIISAKLKEKANIFRIDGNDESALRVYNQIIKLNPNDYISLYWVGEIYKNQKNIISAKEYFSKALSINPDFKSAGDALYEILIKDNENK